MGVVNVTPDSFSDGGQWYGADAAIAHGLDLAAQGAGLGFGKRPEHNWPLLARLAELGTLAGGTFPVLVGASRKGFLGKLLAGHDGTPRTLADRDQATVAVTALAAAAGAWCVRVHVVPPNADAVLVGAAWRLSR